MAKIRILAYGAGQEGNGKVVGIISGYQEEQQGFFFAQMIEKGGRQHWIKQQFFPEESQAWHYWQRQRTRR